jgi:hypothetical protein
MQFTKLLVAAAAFAAASAQIVKFTNSDFAGITVGTPFNITWAGATSDITLKLKNGPSNAQNTVMTIASEYSPGPIEKLIKSFLGNLPGTSYLWTPASNLVDGIYNLEIDHGSDKPNYSVQFTISGGLTSSSSVSSASTTSTSTSTSASVTTTSTSTASSVSNSTSSASKTASSTTSKSCKSCYPDLAIEYTNDALASSSTTSSTATVPSSNNAAQYASPFAFVLMSFIAIAALS